MASGVAPLATPTGAALELIEEGITGYFVAVRSPRGVRSALHSLPHDRARLREIGRTARARVLKERRGEAMVASYARAYRAALGEPAGLLEMLDHGGAVVIVAHPDDETLWCGGLRLLHPWLDWTFVVATHFASSPRVRELASIAEEAQAELHCLELEDRLDRPLDIELRARLEALPWGRFRFVFTHGAEGEYGHPHHRAVHRAVVELLARRRDAGEPTPRLFCFAPSGIGESIVLPPIVAARKAELLERYRSEGRRTRLLAHAARSLGREFFREVTP
ncbi:MAG: PIG-L family deacetylase [Candidatus Eisenbacteria bacterium]